MASISLSTFVRVKPASTDEATGSTVRISGESSIFVGDQSCAGFSHILTTTHDQQYCYERTCLSLMDSFMEGYNCTLFMYGQTGSGKTHTLFGPPDSFNPNSLSEATESFEGVCIPSTWGAFPRSMLNLLSRVGSKGSLGATAVEIYLDNCYDLMNEKVRVPIAGFGRSLKNTVNVEDRCNTNRRDSNGKWIPPYKMDGSLHTGNEAYEASGAKTIKIENVHDLLSFMTIIDTNRSSKSHNLNARSSRSHCVITVTMNGVNLPKGKLMMVDLAGSERILKSGSVGIAASEAKNINTSLSALGRVIAARGKKENYVPYRDSSLTMLLKQSLGGNCVTSVVVTIAEDPAMAHESLCTLQFGQRCAKVVTKRIKPPAQRPAEDRIRDAKATLMLLDQELEKMVQAGFAGGLNPEHLASTQKPFIENKERMKKHVANIQTLKANISAHKSSQSTNSGELHALMTSLKYEESQAYNLKGILVRSMMTGVWLEPTRGYIKKLTQRKAIIAELMSLGETVTGKEPPEPLLFEDLMRGFEG